MEDLYLSEFMDLTKTCSYQTTAINMSISVSTLSKHISKLEEEVEVPLFDRSTRTVTLNEYGKIFLGYSIKSIELKQQLLAAIHSQMRKEEAELSIGIMPITQYYGIPDFIYEFKKLYPNINIRMSEKRYMADFFKKDPCDFVFADIQHLNGVKTDSLPFIVDNMVAVLPLNHPLAGRHSIDLIELKDEKFIMNGLTDDSLSRSSIEFSEKAQLSGFIPNIVTVLSNYSAVVSLVARGNGITVINKGLIARQFRDKVAVVDLNTNLGFNIFCLYRSEITHSAHFDTFLKFVKARAPLEPQNFLLEFGGIPGVHDIEREP